MSAQPTRHAFLRGTLRLAALAASALAVTFVAAAPAVAATPKIIVAAGSQQLVVQQKASHEYVDYDTRTIVYTFKVTNTGSEQVRSVAIKQSVPGYGHLSRAFCLSSRIAAGKSTTCWSAYRPGDHDYALEMPITSTATAVGTVRSGAVIESASTETTFLINQAGSIGLGSAVEPASASRIGDQVEITFYVSNRKDLPLRNLVARATSTGSGKVSRFVCAQTTLAPGETTTCTASYTVTAEDVSTLDAIEISGHAFATNSNGVRLQSNPILDAFSLQPVL